MIQARNLAIALNGQLIVSRLSFESESHKVIAIMGPSGCGKSTLLRGLMGIHRFSEGEFSINGQFSNACHWTEQQNVFTLVPQIPLLLPWKTLLNNVAMAAPRSDSQEVTQSKAKELLHVVGLADAMHKYPWQVSQGMAARTSFARTLMLASEVLLLDEPFAAIDATTRFRLQLWLLEKIKELNLQAIIVTHDPRESLLLADEVIILRGTPASIGKVITLPERAKRQNSDWIYSSEAGALERQIRVELDL
jgi:ABC-type nitrate/sulfonate/bicarbonate transport system ATPase subunit